MSKLMQCPGPCGDGEVCWCGVKAELAYGTLSDLLTKIKQAHPEASESEARWSVIEALIGAAFEVAEIIHDHDDDHIGSVQWHERFSAEYDLQQEILRRLHRYHNGRVERDNKDLIFPAAKVA